MSANRFFTNYEHLRYTNFNSRNHEEWHITG